MTKPSLTIPTYNRIPSAPLLAYVDRQGTVTDLPGITGLTFTVETVQVSKDREVLRTEEFIQRTDEERRALERSQKFLERARKRGWVDLLQVDEFCIEILGVHPAQVYGIAAWVDFLEEHPIDLEEVESRILSGELATTTDVVRTIRVMGATTEEVEGEDGQTATVTRLMNRSAAQRHMSDLDPEVLAQLGKVHIAQIVDMPDWERELFGIGEVAA